MTVRASDVIVLGASPTGLYAVRELAKADLAVAVADVAEGCAFSSRHVAGGHRSFVGDLQAIERWLLGMPGASGNRPVLLPTSDLFIEFLLERRERLAAGFAFADCHQGLAAELLDKSLFHALCGRHGMPTPGVWPAEDSAGLLALAGRVPYPCILKPMLIHRARGFLKGKKVLIARDQGEFEAHARQVPTESGGWLVQEVITGPESDITLFAGYVGRDGRLQQAFTARKLRQYPPGFGSASLVLSAPCVETLSLTEEFLGRIGFRGVCGAEFKRDPRDGRLKIIEINPRPTLWFQVSHDSGKRVVEAAVRDLSGGGIAADPAQAETVLWRYGLKDLASAAFYTRRPADFILPGPDVSAAGNATRKSWPVFDATDPRPALAEPAGYLRKAWRRRS